MRICGGEAKGRTLIFTSRSTQRPTTDFLREALFNVLKRQENESFLDLFAGSGSVGLEAASRGAKHIAFVEKTKLLVDILRKNIATCGYEEKCLIIHADIHLALKNLSIRKSCYDVIFADPPYNEGFLGETLNTLYKNPVWEGNSLIVLQHSIREPLPQLAEGWHVADQRKYGDNVLTFIRTGN